MQKGLHGILCSSNSTVQHRSHGRKSDTFFEVPALLSRRVQVSQSDSNDYPSHVTENQSLQLEQTIRPEQESIAAGKIPYTEIIKYSRRYTKLSLAIYPNIERGNTNWCEKNFEVSQK